MQGGGQADLLFRPGHFSKSQESGEVEFQQATEASEFDGKTASRRRRS